MSTLEKLFLIKKTQIELVRDRGFDVGDEANILQWKLSDFVHYLATAIENNQDPRAFLTSIYEWNYDNENTEKDKHPRRFLAYYAIKMENMKQISVDVVRDFNLILRKNNITDSIFIADTPISTKAESDLKQLVDINWQLFNDNELTHNPTKHVKVPKHVLLPPDVAEAKLKEMRIDITKAPMINVNDPIVKYYGWKIGGLVKIYRNDSSISTLAPLSINYRVIFG